jgi:hypothetical protein
MKQAIECLLLALILGCATWIANRHLPLLRSASATQIVYEMTGLIQLDDANLLIDPDASVSFRLKNTSAEEVKVTGIEKSCGCLKSVLLSSNIIQPVHECIVQLTGFNFFAAGFHRQHIKFATTSPLFPQIILQQQINAYKRSGFETPSSTAIDENSIL